MSDREFSRSEREIRAFARRRANAQLVRVPWSRFRKAYEEYPRWQALALWVQAVIAARDTVPAWLTDDLRKHCPGFVEHEEPSYEPKAIGLHLLEWAHNHEFAFARRQGWLDALTFYGVRHPRSESAWTYWEYCENHWTKDQQEALPTFDKWWRQAQKTMLCDKISYCDLGKAVERYLDWEALVLWLRPLFASKAKLPRHILSEIERKVSGILQEENSRISWGNQENCKIWRRLIKLGKDHSLREARDAGWLEPLLQRVPSHPRHVLLFAYGKHWAEEWSRTRTHYPSFLQWKLAADRYVVTSLK